MKTNAHIPRIRIITRGASQSTVRAVQYGLEDISQDPTLLAPQQITFEAEKPEKSAMTQANAAPIRVNPVSQIGTRCNNFTFQVS